MQERVATGLAAGAFAILMAAGSLKAVLLYLNQPALTALDPLLGLSAKVVAACALALEAGLCLLCMLRPWRFLWAVLLTAVASQFVLYHATLLILRKTGRCYCLGQLWEWLAVSDKSASTYTLGVACYLFATGIVVTIARAPKGLQE